ALDGWIHSASRRRVEHRHTQSRRGDAVRGRSAVAMTARLRELAAGVTIAAALAVVMAWPLAAEMGGGGRLDNGDGMFSIWNVSWVAHALITRSARVFDANIFYPHTGTLAYSESNLAAGALAVPVYWATRNPFAAHNSVVLMAFILSATGMFS